MIFFPIAFVAFYVLIRFEVFSVEVAVQEFSLIVLGTFVLLAVRETLDYEGRRRSVLKKQNEVLVEAYTAFTVFANDYASLIGIRYGYSLFSSREEIDKSIQEAKGIKSGQPFAIDERYRSEVIIETGQFRDYCIELRQLVSDVGFIDDDRGSLRSSITAILNDLAIPPESKSNVYADHYICMIRDMKHFIDTIKRPWNYAMDREKEKALLERYEEYKIEIGQHDRR